MWTQNKTIEFFLKIDQKTIFTKKFMSFRSGAIYLNPKVVWLGHASFRIESELGTVYVDPWKLKDPVKADIILITHSHHDHMSGEDIKKLEKKGTRVVGPDDVAENLEGVDPIKPGESKKFDGIKIEAHRAYNIDKEFHPKSSNWVGYVMDIGGYRIYHSGDTDVIPEMENLEGIDIALLPVGGTYTMRHGEAAQAVDKIKPKKAIPMHWGDIVGDIGSAEKFKDLASCEVEIPQKSD